MKHINIANLLNYIDFKALKMFVEAYLSLKTDFKGTNINWEWPSGVYPMYLLQ